MTLAPSKRHAFFAEQQFGRGVGGIVCLIGFWLCWRSTGAAGWTVLAIGLLLVLFGFGYPRALVWPNRAWMRMAEGLSWVSTRVILWLVFSVAVIPIGLLMRMTGWDPLGRRRADAESYWESYPSRQQDPTHFEKMF